VTVKTDQASAADDTSADGLPRVGKRLSQVNPTRSLLLMSAGALLGLFIAGFGLFTARGSTSNAVPPEDVALVNNRPVLVSDFVAQAEAEAAMPFGEISKAERRKVLDSMIREELYVQRGLELDFPSSDPDTRTALVAAVEQQVAADVTAQQPTEAELMAYYEKNKLKYSSDGTMTLHELVLAGPADAGALAKAAQAVQALRAHTPVEAVMAKYGLKESGRVNDGEEFYFAAKIHLGDKLFNLAQALPSGAVSDPQAMPDGVHILAMVKNTMPVALGFADARENVFFDFKKAEEKKLQDADEKYLRAKADIQIAKEYR
jgi:parvulin-like peptidyl-prolyl isomerase